MSLSIEEDKIVSNIYEKRLALYLNIPHHPEHPPGVLAGLIMRNTLWIHQLCTNKADIEDMLDTFFKRLLNHSHQVLMLLPIFLKSIYNMKAHLLQCKGEISPPKTIRRRQPSKGYIPISGRNCQCLYFKKWSQIWNHQSRTVAFFKTDVVYMCKIYVRRAGISFIPNKGLLSKLGNR